MRKIDFDKVSPDFVQGDFKWYVCKDLTNYIDYTQADNLPSLEGKYGVFIVKNDSDSILDYVLINNKQEVISTYEYSSSGLEQMTAKINIIKISKHYDDHEQL